MPDGLAQAFIIGADFIGDDTVRWFLAITFFCRTRTEKRLEAAVKNAETGKWCDCIWLLCKDDPERFGIVEFDNSVKALSIEENRKTEE